MADAHLTQTPRGRLVDLVMAGTLIALTLPLMGMIALAIKCDSRGSVFVRGARCVDARGRRFAPLKFRTTIVDRELGQAARHADMDANVTRVGLFLRYTRLDSLPQLINVLRGEMTCISAGSDRTFFLD